MNGNTGTITISTDCFYMYNSFLLGFLLLFSVYRCSPTYACGCAIAGVYSANLHKHYLLLDPDWKDDIVPEIMDGHNIADFVDADILQRLDELEREEDERAAAAENGMDEDEDMSDQVGFYLQS